MDRSEPVILQDAMPAGQAERAAARLPSMRPVEGAWLWIDEAYGAQVAQRRRLIEARETDVYRQLPDGMAASQAFLRDVLEVLPHGYVCRDADVVCPDGAVEPLDWSAPLRTAGRILQQDVCILEKQGAEHVLTGACLCFPASWTLAEKIGQPLGRIHRPVSDYDASIAARVQRMFDGVQRGRPMWRANHLHYSDPALYQPRPEDDQRPVGSRNDRYVRSERQTALRLAVDGAVAFVIHTVVVDTAA